MKKLKYFVLTVLLLSPFFYFFVGFEIIVQDHYVNYDPFIKKHPTTMSIFKNGAHCGECDFVEYKDISSEDRRTDFRNLCYYRYDLTDIKQCENLFRY